MKFFDFGAFQKIMKILSHYKIIFHMLFGAFHDTPLYAWKIVCVHENLFSKFNIILKRYDSTIKSLRSHFVELLQFEVF